MRRATPYVAFIVSIIVILAGFNVTVAAPKVLAVCGASEGYSYYFPSAINQNTAGWTKDGISKGQLVLVIDKSGFDIVFPGLDGQVNSVRAQGGQIVSYGASGDLNEVILAVSYNSGVVETYFFRFSDAKYGDVLFTKLLGGGILPKGEMLHAKCQR